MASNVVIGRQPIGKREEIVQRGATHWVWVEQLQEKISQIRVLMEGIKLFPACEYFAKRSKELSPLVFVQQILLQETVEVVLRREVSENPLSHDHLEQGDAEHEDIYLLAVESAVVAFVRARRGFWNKNSILNEVLSRQWFLETLCLGQIVEVRNITGVFFTLTDDDFGCVDVQQADFKFVQFVDCLTDLIALTSDQMQSVAESSALGVLDFLVG